MKTIARHAAVLLLVLLACPAAAKVRLGVVVSVDQMRPDYLERVFARLREEGAVFAKARHTHVPTETAPGHAAISTGRLPETHGIVGNDWYDRVAGKDAYCVADAVFGIGPEHLSGPTLADALKAGEPAARVFSVSSKDRSAVLLGGRKADLVLWFDRGLGEFTTSGYYRRPAWLDAFNAALKKSALLPLTDGKVPSSVMASPALDQATRRLVSELVVREKVGRGPGTDLLLVSFSGTDTVGHSHGIQSAMMDAQLESLDREFTGLLAELEAASGGDLVLALSADHGAVPEPEGPLGRGMGIRRLDWLAFGRSLEAALQKKWPAKDRRRIVSYQVPHIYLDQAFVDAKGLEPIARVLRKVDGVGAVLIPAAVAGGAHDGDAVAAVVARSIRADRSGDLFVITAPDVLLHDKVPGTSHGSPWDYDAAVPLVFWGKGVRRGRVEAPAAVIDLAPTMARLLGFDYPPAPGGAVRLEALAEAR
ncbi:MAG: alkaline phosphatase family protein [Elusimicrobiota bacterium]|nr:alkaline phosphatase family protein [Elusimicrobiota bacterium]